MMRGEELRGEAVRHEAPTGWRWMLRDIGHEAARHLRILPRNVEILIFAVIQPIMFIVLFVYVFGGDPDSGVRRLQAVAAARDLRSNGGVRFGVHERRLGRGHAVRPRRAFPLAADVAGGGHRRADRLGSPPQHDQLRGDVRGRIPRRLPVRRFAARGGRSDRSAVVLQLCVQLDPGLHRTVGHLGRGGELGRVHLDVPRDVRVVGVRRYPLDELGRAVDRQGEPL